MKRIFGLGETVLDVIFKNNEPVASRPGGSAFNALVSLGRAGLDTYLISEIAQDLVGNRIIDFLNENNIKIDWLHRFKNGKTPVALAFLDEENNASYQVYKDFPQERFDVTIPDFQPGDILLFGSFFAVNPVIRPKVISFLQKAREDGAFLIYDPNFRKNHVSGIELYRPIIEENFALAHLVRGSDEDFQTIYEELAEPELLDRINGFGSDSMITCNSKGIYCHISGETFHVKADVIEPISTIGAGDNFNAGLIYGFYRYGFPVSNDVERWKKIVTTAVSFSTNVCLSFDNYVSHDFVKNL